ncbi:MAG: hypothetical protein ACR2QS_11115 [Woeseiaceae bacterium]
MYSIDHGTDQFRQPFSTMIEDASVCADPFPHIQINDFQPDSAPIDVWQHMPDDQLYDWCRNNGHRGLFSLSPENLRVLPESSQAFWLDIRRHFLADEFATTMLAKFGPSAHRVLTERCGTVDNDYRIFSELKLLRDRPGYQHPSHVDHPSVLLICLLYLPRDDENRELGTQLYLPNDQTLKCTGGIHYGNAEFRCQRQIPYQFGSGVCIPATAASFHGLNDGNPIPNQRDLMALTIKVEQSSSAFGMRRLYRRFRGSRSAPITLTADYLNRLHQG